MAVGNRLEWVHIRKESGTSAARCGHCGGICCIAGLQRHFSNCDAAVEAIRHADLVANQAIERKVKRANAFVNRQGRDDEQGDQPEAKGMCDATAALDDDTDADSNATCLWAVQKGERWW